MLGKAFSSLEAPNKVYPLKKFHDFSKFLYSHYWIQFSSKQLLDRPFRKHLKLMNLVSTYGWDCRWIPGITSGTKMIFRALKPLINNFHSPRSSPSKHLSQLTFPKHRSWHRIFMLILKGVNSRTGSKNLADSSSTDRLVTRETGLSHLSFASCLKRSRTLRSQQSCGPYRFSASQVAVRVFKGQIHHSSVTSSPSQHRRKAW